MRKIIYILIFCANTIFAQNESIITKTIKPISFSDIPVCSSNFVKGGVHTVQSITDRNNIPESRQLLGMICFVKDNQQTYQLQFNGTTKIWIPVLNKYTTINKALATGNNVNCNIDLNEGINFRISKNVPLNQTHFINLNVNDPDITSTYVFFVHNSGKGILRINVDSHFKLMRGSDSFDINPESVSILVAYSDSASKNLYYTVTHGYTD